MGLVFKQNDSETQAIPENTDNRNMSVDSTPKKPAHQVSH